MTPIARSRRTPPPGALFWGVAGLARWLWPLIGKLSVDGTEHIPPSGPLLLLSNHQSVLDPFFIQTFCPRPCHAMAKSTQFAAPGFAALMTRLQGFPVRRFQVDPHAVRIALRRLEQGECVHIYVEGERTWDGSLQEARPGTIRLALRAGVPILPVVVDGAFDAWPRWARTPRSAPVHVRFGPQFRLPHLPERAAREAALPEATAEVMDRLRSMLDDVRAQRGQSR